MKGSLLFISIFALSMLFIPMIALSYETDVKPAVMLEEDSVPLANPLTPLPQEESEPPEPLVSGDFADFHDDNEISLTGTDSFRILDESTGEIHMVTARDFVRGAVAAEMPASFHIEALKAQAVAAHTFALRNCAVQRQNPSPELKGADFSADPSNMKVYVTEGIARDFYGSKGDEYWGKISEAADSVLDLALEYGGEPIVAAYHAISAGQTEDAANLWSGYAPYLAAASSEGDILAPDFETERIFSAQQLKEAFLSEYPGMSFADSDEEAWISGIERSPSGYITSVTVGGMELHGKEVRRILELRSHNFEVLRSERGFSFIVYGYGHGVGLSQYGADFMARQGAGFREILENYYTGAQLVTIR